GTTNAKGDQQREGDEQSRSRKGPQHVEVEGSVPAERSSLTAEVDAGLGSGVPVGGVEPQRKRPDGRLVEREGGRLGEKPPGGVPKPWHVIRTGQVHERRLPMHEPGVVELRARSERRAPRLRGYGQDERRR